MNIEKYKKSKYFNRDGTIFVLYHFDHWKIESLMGEFNMSRREVKKVIRIFKMYF